MEQLQTLRVLEDELGEVLKSGLSGESLYYCAEWDEIWERAWEVAKQQSLATPSGDVRCANYALSLLNIPVQRVEADEDERGRWIIYWR